MKDVYKYIYIDDNKNEAEKGVIAFKSEHLFVKVVQNCSDWKNQVEYIVNEQDNIDGLMLDLRLDDIPVGKYMLRADFRGSSIAQEIRSRQKEGKIKQFPVILYSANNKIKSSFDTYENNIFDLIIDKGDIDEEKIEVYKKQLISLTVAYNTIAECKNYKRKITSLLNIDNILIDERFIYALHNCSGEQSNIIIHFLLNKLILHQGLLIDEKVLAARLGIDIEDSTDWPELLKFFESCKYNGILKEGWERWWVPLIEDMWSKLSKEEPYLQMLDAKKRVSILVKKTKIKGLKPAKVMDKASSSKFWTICQAYKQPLDPIDGLMISGQQNLSSWLEPLYVSIEGALRRHNHGEWGDVESFEQSRLNDLKNQYSERT